MYINVVHRYSHLGENLLRTTYHDLGVKLTGTLQFYGGCAKSKAKARAVRKMTYTRVSHPGERIFVDTTSSFPERFIGDRYWIGVGDDYSNYSCSFFTKTKLQLPKSMEKFFEKITSRGTPVKYLCCDNAGEHQSKLQRACQK